MKKQLSIILLLTLLLSMTGIKAYAHDFEVVNADGKTIYYIYNEGEEGTTVAVYCRGSYGDHYSDEYSGDIVIPESVTYKGKTYSVTDIGYGAFFGCSGLTSVTIPNSVTLIYAEAFKRCSGLTSVTIPNSVTLIYAEAFMECSGLTSVTIPNSVTDIEYFAFFGCSGLTSVTIPNSVTSIGFGTFGNCSGLTSLVVDSGNSVYDSRGGCNAIIKTSNNELVAGCKNTIIPNSVTTICQEAFSGCSDLTSVTIPNSVTSIGDRAFRYCI